ncbi:MAG: nitronate monooxygenase [bacterium]
MVYLKGKVKTFVVRRKKLYVMKIPNLAIKGFTLEHCLFQGGMGVGVSLAELAGAVSKEDGLGIISSAGLRTIVSLRDRKAVDTYTAVRIELERAQDLSGGCPIGINVMCALVGDYEDTIRASIDAGVGAIISGAGLPLGLPGIKPPGNTALIPIISSARALEIIVKRWGRLYYRPDAVVLEGPLAGGHLGFRISEVDDPEFALEKLLPPVLDVAHRYGDFPVIVAGGIYTNQDIERFLAMGASGVQMATRFLVTHESSATPEYKQAVIDAGKDDITVVAFPESVPASPCGLPFRIIKKGSPAYTKTRPPRCNRGYVLQRGPEGKLSVCQAMPGSPNSDKFFCICNNLLASAGYDSTESPLYTVGSNAYRVDRTCSVAELMKELCGK